MSHSNSLCPKKTFNHFTIPQIVYQAICGLSIALGTLTAPSVLAQDEPDNATTTFLVERHAEREGNLDKLTDTGRERAQALASIGRALNVQVIYSTDTARTKGTAQPMAAAADTMIQTYGRPSQTWIESLKQKHSGQAVLIVGHSNTAGAIAGMLAQEKPYPIAHDEYDALFIVQVSESETRSMRLRFGSSSVGASSADPDKMGEIDAARQTK